MTPVIGSHEITKTDFVEGEQCYLYDAQGRAYIDFESGIWCTALGHSHPRITQVIQTQSKRLMHLGTRYPNAQTEAAAHAVLDLVGIDEGKCTFLSSGSEAVEFGVQAVRRATGRPQLLTFTCAYLGAYGSAGSKRRDEWQLLDWDACNRADPDECLDGIPFERIGAFVFEPGGSGSGFVRFPPRALVQAIAQRVREADGLIMVNEVTTGMGRTGRWFGFQHYDLRPDIVALGKGLGNGYPVSAVAMARDVAESVEASHFHYAQSHQNDPLGCAVAQEVIAAMEEGDWVERGRAMGAFFLQGLKRLEAKHPIAKEARGRGLLLGLELVPDAPLSVQAVYERLLTKRLLVGYYAAGNMLRFDPALTIGKAEITRLLEELDRILSEVGDTESQITTLNRI